MFCKNCGHQISELAVICPKCGIPPTNVEHTNFCFSCGNKVESEGKFCTTCGVSLNGINLESSSWKTADIKAISKVLISKDRVQGNKVFNLLYLIPFIIITLILNVVSYSFNPFSYPTNIIFNLLLSVLPSILLYNLFLKSSTTIKEGIAEFDFKFDVAKWLPLLIIAVITGILIGVQVTLDNIDSYSFIFPTSYTFISLLISIFIIVISVITPLISYISVSRNYDLGQTLSLGIKLGFKHFGKLLILSLSFIPLVLLIILTLGILSFWKGYYMFLSISVLCEKILIKEGL